MRIMNGTTVLSHQEEMRLASVPDFIQSLAGK